MDLQRAWSRGGVDGDARSACTGSADVPGALAGLEGMITRSARDSILERLRMARPTRLPRAEAPAPVPTPRRSIDECVRRFVDEARALGVEIWIESTPADVRTRVTTLAAGLRVLSWDREHLPYDVGALTTDAIRGGASREEQALADVGITGCDRAIAETGSLALITRPGRSRAVSLLPPFHIAVLSRLHFCYTMAEFFEDCRHELAAASSCTFITGPSRTADIELTLTLGIHGPGRVAVVIGP
jgi:L-lactate dehydrogenase complex protein LldG